jgi:hypothetical protein
MQEAPASRYTDMLLADIVVGLWPDRSPRNMKRKKKYG